MDFTISDFKLYFRSVRTFVDKKVGHIESGPDGSGRVWDVRMRPLECVFLRVPLGSINWKLVCCASVKGKLGFLMNSIIMKRSRGINTSRTHTLSPSTVDTNSVCPSVFVLRIR